MGTFYNSRALEWFELGRTELLRRLGTPYADVESRGVYLPPVEAQVKFEGRAGYDDELSMTSRVAMAGKVRLRFEVEVVPVRTGTPVADGYTVQAFTDRSGKPIRPPAWFLDALAKGVDE